MRSGAPPAPKTARTIAAARPIAMLLRLSAKMPQAAVKSLALQAFFRAAMGFRADRNRGAMTDA